MSDVVQHHAIEPESLQFSERAKAHILSFLQSNPHHKALLFYVEKTGCSGLSYQVGYLTDLQPQAVPVLLDGAAVVYMDKKSYPYLKGTMIDYVKQGLNHKFVFENPNQTGQCGCGESFKVD